MKKLFTKENIGVLVLYILVFLGIYMAIVRGQYIFGSKLDFQTQHYIIPEYFRNLFYETHDLFPDFAFHLGSGQNIYYFSYYGLLSPIVLISYLFPNISMLNYIIIAMSIIVIVSSYLMYFYLKKNGYCFLVSFLGGLFLLCSAPFLFHAHRHIMFMNYMVFLIMGMFGVDTYFKNNKSSLLIISCFLMILTSYYYSVGGLVALYLLGISRYLESHSFELKSFGKAMVKFALLFIIAILMSMILLLPTLYTLLSGRMSGNVQISILDLFMPSLSFKHILYGTYSMGVSAIVIIASTYFIFKGKRNERFLSLVLVLIGSFPIFNYILNGTLYIDAKSLIPLLPLAILITMEFLNKVIDKQIEFKDIIKVIGLLLILGGINLIFILIKLNSGLSQTWAYLGDLALCLLVLGLYCKFRKKVILGIYFFVFLVGTCLGINLTDELMEKNDYSNDYETIEEIISGDSSFYRINNFYLNGVSLNKILNMNQYQSTLYSSVYNKLYNQFYYDVFNNPVPYRNRSMTAFSNNILFSIYNGEKYVITNQSTDLGYDNYTIMNGLKVYENEDVFPIGYASSKVLNREEYQALNYPSTVINLLKSVVVKDESSTTSPLVLDKSEIDFEVVSSENLEYETTLGGYQIVADEKAKMKIKINSDVSNKLLFIRFKNNHEATCSENDLAIHINGMVNKLTCKTWKYHNQNFVFDYVLYNQDELNITFNKGLYDLSDFEIYLLDYEEIKGLNKELDNFVIDKEKTKGDVIEGDIEVTEDGYFVIQIPYDKGFKILVDEEKIDYELVNEGYLGFKINKGEHHIVITYEAPYKKLGVYISVFGWILFWGYSVFWKKNKFLEHTNS